MGGAEWGWDGGGMGVGGMEHAEHMGSDGGGGVGKNWDGGLARRAWGR